MTAPRRKPESVRLKVSFEYEIGEHAGVEEIERERHHWRSGGIPKNCGPERLRVERVRAKPKGKRP